MESIPNAARVPMPERKQITAETAALYDKLPPEQFFSRFNWALRIPVTPLAESKMTSRQCAHLLTCFTKKSAMMWLASWASGSRGSYQKACGSASKTTSRASTPALR